jgi:hypothetical protein
MARRGKRRGGISQPQQQLQAPLQQQQPQAPLQQQQLQAPQPQQQSTFRQPTMGVDDGQYARGGPVRGNYARGGYVRDEDTVYGSTAPDWSPEADSGGYRDEIDPYRLAMLRAGYSTGYADGGPVRRTGYQEGGEVEEDWRRRQREIEAEIERTPTREMVSGDPRKLGLIPADTSYASPSESSREKIGMPTGYGDGEQAAAQPRQRGSTFSDVLDYLHDSVFGRAQAAEAAPATGYRGAGGAPAAGGYGGELVTPPAQNLREAAEQTPPPAAALPLDLRSTAPPTISGQATPAVAAIPGDTRLAEVEREIAARPQVDTSKMGTLEKLARLPGALLERYGDASRRADAEREMFTGSRFAVSDVDRPILPRLKQGLDDMLRGDRSHTPAEAHQVLRTISDDPQADHNPMVQKTFDSLKTLEDKAAFTQTLRDPYNRYVGIAQAAIDRGNMPMALKFLEQAHNLLPNNQKLNIVQDKDGSFVATVRPEGQGGGKAFSVRLTDPRDIYNLATRDMQFDTVGKVGLQRVFERMAEAKASGTAAAGAATSGAAAAPAATADRGPGGIPYVGGTTGTRLERGQPVGSAEPWVGARGARVNVKELVGPGPTPDDPSAVLANREQVQRAIQGGPEREALLQREAQESPAAIEGRRAAAATANVTAQEEAARNRFYNQVRGRPNPNVAVPIQGETVAPAAVPLAAPAAAPAAAPTAAPTAARPAAPAAPAAAPVATRPELPPQGFAEGVASRISGTPPPSAIQALLKYANDPRIVADFDNKFGRGAAERMLKQYTRG